MINHVRPSKFFGCWWNLAHYLCSLPLIFFTSNLFAQSFEYFTTDRPTNFYSSPEAACTARLGNKYHSVVALSSTVWSCREKSAFNPANFVHFVNIQRRQKINKCEANKDMGTQEAWNVREVNPNGSNLTCSPGGCEVSITFEGMLIGPESQGIYGPATQTGNECTPDEDGGGDDEPNPDKCPSGYVPSKHVANVCVPEEEPDRECPNGYSPSRHVKGVCVPNEEPNRECPAGFQLHATADVCVPKPKDPTEPKPDGSGDDSGEGDGEGAKCGAPGQPRCNVHDVNVEAAVRDVEKAIEINTEALIENTKETVAVNRAVDENTTAVKDGSKSTKDALNSVKSSVDSTKSSVDGVKDAVSSGTSKLDQSLKNIEEAIKNQKPGTGGGGTGGDGDGGEGEEEGESDMDKYCKENPKALPCSGIEEVEGEGEGTGQETVTITYQAEGLFSGGGSCPANSVTRIGGQNLTIWDWAMACGFISTYVRPIVIALAFMSALMILIPRNE